MGYLRRLYWNREKPSNKGRQDYGHGSQALCWPIGYYETQVPVYKREKSLFSLILTTEEVEGDVLELGCGVGLLGIITASIQKASKRSDTEVRSYSLCMSDVDEIVVTQCRRNLQLPASRCACQVCEDWLNSTSTRWIGGSRRPHWVDFDRLARCFTGFRKPCHFGVQTEGTKPFNRLGCRFSREHPGSYHQYSRA